MGVQDVGLIAISAHGTLESLPHDVGVIPPAGVVGEVVAQGAGTGAQTEPGRGRTETGRRKAQVGALHAAGVDVLPQSGSVAAHGLGLLANAVTGLVFGGRCGKGCVDVVGPVSASRASTSGLDPHARHFTGAGLSLRLDVAKDGPFGLGGLSVHPILAVPAHGIAGDLVLDRLECGIVPVHLLLAELAISVAVLETGLAILVGPYVCLILGVELLIRHPLGYVVQLILPDVGLTKLILGKFQPVLPELRILQGCCADIRIWRGCRTAALFEEQQILPRLSLGLLAFRDGQPIHGLRCKVTHQKQGNHCQAHDHCFNLHGPCSCIREG